jgi:hypothetical protein
VDQLLKPHWRSKGRLAPCKAAFCALVNPSDPIGSMLNTSLPYLARGQAGLQTVSNVKFNPF